MKPGLNPRMIIAALIAAVILWTPILVGLWWLT